MNHVYVVFDYKTCDDLMAFETRAMADSFMNHPANFKRTLDVAMVSFRYADSDIDIPEFMR